MEVEKEIVKLSKNQQLIINDIKNLVDASKAKSDGLVKDDVVKIVKDETWTDSEKLKELVADVKRMGKAIDTLTRAVDKLKK